MSEPMSAADTLSVWLHLGPWFAWTCKILQWPIVFVLATIGIGLISDVADIPRSVCWMFIFTLGIL